MESIDLQMEDLFDNDAAVDGDEDGFMTGEQEAEDAAGGDHDEPATQTGEDGDVLAQLRDLSKGAAKKKVMKPQPKLDHIRLTGDRGIPILPKLFEKTSFKGKGHEGEDLKLMMSKLEHWAHRLFPKMTFDEVIERAERLGVKKSVQTCVKRMRLDMPILDDDFVSRGNEDEEGAAAAENENQDVHDTFDADAEDVLDELLQADDSSHFSQPPPIRAQDEDEALEAMLQEEAEMSQSQPRTANHVTPNKAEMSQSQPRTANHITPNKAEMSQSQNRTANHVTPNKAATPQSSSESLTAEQKERMERNRRQAMEKRLSRLGKSPAASSESPTTALEERSKSTSQDQDGDADVTDNSAMSRQQQSAAETSVSVSDTVSEEPHQTDHQTELQILQSLSDEEENEEIDAMNTNSNQDSQQTRRDEHSESSGKEDDCSQSLVAANTDDKANTADGVSEDAYQFSQNDTDQPSEMDTL